VDVVKKLANHLISRALFAVQIARAVFDDMKESVINVDIYDVKKSMFLAGHPKIRD